MLRLVLLPVIALLLSHLLQESLSCDSCLDLTRTDGSTGEAVVVACVRLVRESNVFSEDHGTLRRIAYAETLDGTALPSNGGIWAVSKEAFESTQNQSISSTILADVEAVFHITWSTVVYEQDLGKPLYSALAARIFIQQLQDSGQNTSSVDDQIILWTNHYTSSAHANSDTYLDAVENATTDNAGMIFSISMIIHCYLF